MYTSRPYILSQLHKHSYKPEKDSIKFEQLMTGEKLPSTIITNMKLEELEKYIESLVEENVPVEAIHRKTDTVLQKVKVMKGKK